MKNPDVTEQPESPTPVACSDLLACVEFHENVGSYLVMAAMMPPICTKTLEDMKSRSLKHYEWAKEIRKLIGCEEPWLRKTLDDAKREYKKRPAWAKAG